MRSLKHSFLLLFTALMLLVTSGFAWYISALVKSDSLILLSGGAQDGLEVQLYLGKDWDYDGVLDKYYREEVEVSPLTQTCQQINQNYYDLLSKDDLNSILGIAGDKVISYKFVLTNISDTPLSLAFFIEQFPLSGIDSYAPLLFQIGNFKVVNYDKESYYANKPLYQFSDEERIEQIIPSAPISLWELKNNQRYFDFADFDLLLLPNRIIELEFHLTCLQLVTALDFYHTYYLNKLNSYFSDEFLPFYQMFSDYINACYQYNDHPNNPLPFLDLSEFSALETNNPRAQQNLIYFLNGVAQDMSLMKEALVVLMDELNQLDPDVKLAISRFAIIVTWYF